MVRCGDAASLRYFALLCLSGSAVARLGRKEYAGAPTRSDGHPKILPKAPGKRRLTDEWSYVGDEIKDQLHIFPEPPSLLDNAMKHLGKDVADEEEEESDEEV